MKKLDLCAVKLNNGDGELDVKKNSDGQCDASSNPVFGLRPVRPRDFEILVNLVDFSRLSSIFKTIKNTEHALANNLIKQFKNFTQSKAL